MAIDPVVRAPAWQEMDVAEGARRARRRLASVDLPGLVMIIMALDHTRDFVRAAAMAFRPDDLTRTTPAIFFTRWISHICARFSRSAPASARSCGSIPPGATSASLFRFLWTRRALPV